MQIKKTMTNERLYTAHVVRNKDYTTILIVLFGLGFILRLAWVWFVPIQQFGDFAWFSLAGMNIADGRGYIHEGKPTAAWPVGYPAFLGSIYFVFGKVEYAAHIVQILANVLATYLFYKLLNKLFKHSLLSLISVGFILVYMEQIASVNILGAENLFWLLLVFGLYYIIDATRTSQLILSAIIFTFSVYVKPISLFIPFIVLMIYPYNRSYKLKSILYSISIFYLIIFLGILPWIIRNYYHFNKVGMSNNMGLNLYIGNNPKADGGYMYDEEYMMSDVGNWLENEALVDQRAKQKAIHYIVNNPDSIIKLIPKKFTKLFIHDHFFVGWHYWRNFSAYKTPSHELFIKYLMKHGEDRYTIFKRILPISFFIGFMAVLLIPFFRKRFLKPYLLICVIISYLVCIHLVFFGAERFHFSIMPFLYVIIFFSVFVAVEILLQIFNRLNATINAGKLK